MNEVTAEVREGNTVVLPKVLLAVGEKHVVKGGSKGGYTIKRRANGYYSCTCPAWVNLRENERERTCSHLKTLLGEDYETLRVRAARSVSPPIVRQRNDQPSAYGSKKRSSQASSDPDVFPHANGQAGKKPRKKDPSTFNERKNGPRDLNGAIELLLALKWENKWDATGFWLSEKLDGVRAYWDGERMYSRSGRAWNPPAWFKRRLPTDLKLDGELWMKRDAFDATSGICRKTDTDGWRHINFMVFDAVGLPLLYEDRLKLLKQRLPDGERTPDEIQEQRIGGLICVLPAVQCTSNDHLETLMDAVLDKGGEGLMLRQARSSYAHGRSKTLYKYKRWYDAEALVIGHAWGEGEHAGVMGGVRALMESGKWVAIGSGFTHAQRAAWYPYKGTVVRYRFQELSHDGTPRFPIFEGICADKTKPRDAIVRSTGIRAKAHKDDLKRFFRNVDEDKIDFERSSAVGDDDDYQA